MKRVQGPATSLAYEPAESNVMSRPPRNIDRERLVSRALLLYSYFFIGLFGEALCCMGAYLWVYSYHNVPHSAIFRPENGDSDAWQVDPERNEPLDTGGRTYSPDFQAQVTREVCASLASFGGFLCLEG